MTTDTLTQLKFPIGPFVVHPDINTVTLNSFVETIASAPQKYRMLTEKLSGKEQQKSYRPGAWNVRQLVNHVADMQLLHYFRMKKALTEKDYKELTLVNIDGWAQTPDSLSYAIGDSLLLFESITNRFVYLIRNLDEDQLAISYYHPVRKVMLNQKQAISMSAWHVKHHFEHIRIALTTG
jgi:hypothetical protein